MLSRPFGRYSNSRATPGIPATQSGTQIPSQQDATATNVLGDTYSGKEALSARMADILRTVFKGSTLELKVRQLRFIEPDVAVVDIDAEVRGYRALPPAVVATDGVLRTTMLQVIVREGEQWRVAAFHNVDVKKR